MDNEVKKVEDYLTLKENLTVVRYKGSVNIREMIEKEMYIEAFAHSQLGIEKILRDKIVGVFDPDKARVVRSAIEQQGIKTYELIKWAHFLGATSNDEHGDLTAFNKARNRIMHGHGEWWNVKEYKEALRKAIRFLEKNGM